MKTIYVVQGLAGRHPDDESEWVVRAYTNKARAEECARLAKEEYLRIQERWRNTHSQAWEKEAWEINAHDPNMVFRGFAEATYYVTELELVEE